MAGNAHAGVVVVGVAHGISVSVHADEARLVQEHPGVRVGVVALGAVGLHALQTRRGWGGLAKHALPIFRTDCVVVFVVAAIPLRVVVIGRVHDVVARGDSVIVAAKAEREYLRIARPNVRGLRPQIVALGVVGDVTLCTGGHSRRAEVVAG